MTLDMTVKFAEGSDTIIEGYGVPFGLDLDGQQFTAATERHHEWFPKGGRPILVDHGFDPTIKFTSIGQELSTEAHAAIADRRVRTDGACMCPHRRDQRQRSSNDNTNRDEAPPMADARICSAWRTSRKSASSLASMPMR